MRAGRAGALRSRRGFTLLEVMLALTILLVSLGVLVEAQGNAASMTLDANRMITATQLAQEKLAEARIHVEREGFQQQDVYEKGEFDDFGDEAVNLEFEDLSDFHYEWLVTELDLDLAADMGGLAGNAANAVGGEGASDALGGGGMDLGSLPISGDMVAQMLEPHLREIRVRVWWGDSDEAEENKNEIIITTQIGNPRVGMSPSAAGGAAGTAGGTGAPGTAPAGGRGGAPRVNSGGTR